MTTTIFTEAIDITEATLDTDNRVLRDVVLIRAGESANKRDYIPETLARDYHVFEGAKAYRNHPSKTELKERPERSTADLTGWYSNIRYVDGAIRGDRYFTRNQAGKDALAIAEDIVSGIAPKSLAGLSINAIGKARKGDNGGVVVEAITYAHSVDDVTTPAAGGSYIESVQNDSLAQAFYEALDYDEWLSIREDFTARYESEHRKVRWNADLKEAKAKVSEYAAQVRTLEATNSELAERLAQAEAAAAEATKQVRVVEMLAKVKLPASWKESLKTDMMAAEESEWVALISEEISKAKSAGHKPQVAVNVGGVQVATPVELQTVESLAPRDDEDPIAWRERIERAKRGS